MGKKRMKGKNVQSDDLTEISEPMCKHLRKGLEQGHLKKVLQNVDWGSCQDCRISDNGTPEKSEDETEDRPSIWLCLKCGHRGCGRNSQEKHALKHYETPRSEPHCLVLNLDNWSVWCYLCDNEVQYSSSSRLGQLVDYVRKQVCTNVPNKADCASLVSKDEETKPVENKKVKDHKNEEEKEKKDLLLKEDKIHLNGHPEVTVKGLSNLGNTCFYNAVLQNLSQTPVLRELLKEIKMADYTITIEPPEFSITEPVVITLDQPRPLTLAMCDFLTDMQETKKGTVTPKELFSQVCKTIRFKGYQQQDSQELLRYLLDGMRTEELQRICAGIFKALNNSADKENEELKKKIKDYEKRKITQTFVDRIFGGELTSTIMCEECQTVSLVHESFLDLSLPVLNDQGAKKKTVEKRVKKLQENEMEDDADNIENDSYLKDREETPGTSKHLQKKAKKMAKKQAKSHRRQQKIQEKMIPLTDSCAIEKNEADHISNNGIENAESNSEVASLKQEEKSLNLCEQSCVDQRDNINGHDTTDTHNNNNANAEDSGQLANNEVAMDLPSEDLVSVVECVNKFDHLSLKEDSTLPVDEDEEEEEEEEDDCAANGFHKLSLDEEPDDTDSFSELHNSETKLYQVVNEDPETAFCTLANREEMNTEESSVLHCLYQFTHNEKLCENNKLLCDICTHKQLCGPKTTGKNVKKPVYTNAKKQMLISLAPPILTLHLKRFQQTGYNLQKVNKHIKFPEVIDLAPFCSIKCKNVAEGSLRVLYSLYGIVEHSGTMRSGHYTAYVKTRATTNQLSDLVLHGRIQHTDTETESSKGQWYHISDTRVQAVPVAKVLNAQAYLLFYERLL